jgi:hypothetical protein
VRAACTAVDDFMSCLLTARPLAAQVQLAANAPPTSTAASLTVPRLMPTRPPR